MLVIPPMSYFQPNAFTVGWQMLEVNQIWCRWREITVSLHAWQNHCHSKAAICSYLLFAQNRAFRGNTNMRKVPSFGKTAQRVNSPLALWSRFGTSAGWKQLLGTPKLKDVLNITYCLILFSFLSAIPFLIIPNMECAFFFSNAVSHWNGHFKEAPKLGRYNIFFQ